MRTSEGPAGPIESAGILSGGAVDAYLPLVTAIGLLVIEMPS
jgi:hypothetical protein